MSPKLGFVLLVIATWTELGGAVRRFLPQGNSRKRSPCDDCSEINAADLAAPPVAFDFERLLHLRRRLRGNLARNCVDDVLAFSARLRYHIAVRTATVATSGDLWRWSVYVSPSESGQPRYSASGPATMPWSLSAISASDGVTQYRSRPGLSVSHMYGRQGEVLLVIEQDSQGTSLFLAQCTVVAQFTVFFEWLQERCSDGIGTVSNASAATLWPDGRCRTIAAHCATVWTYRDVGANPKTPCWESISSSASARMAPDGKRVVLHSAIAPADYLWDFGVGEPPRLLQDRAPRCPGAEDAAGVDDDSCAGFSDDGALYVSRNSTHVQVFESSAWTVVLELGFPEDWFAESEGLALVAPIRELKLQKAGSSR